MPSPDVELRLVQPFAQRHHGLITLPRAASLGVSRSSWYRAVNAGLLELLHPGVARLPGAPDTLPQRALAAVWAVGAGALASHRTSASLWGIARPDDDPTEVLLTSRARCVQLPGVVVHRPRDMADLRPVLRDGVPTTSPVRMLLDLGAVEPDAVLGVASTLLADRVVSPKALLAALARHAKRGRNGVSAYRSMLDRLADDRMPSDSELEIVMAGVVRQFDLPPVRFHARVAGYEVDFLVEDSIVIVECDGWESHGLNRDQFEFDRLREADLTAAGFVVVRVTWRQLTTDAAGAAARILATIRRWSPQVLGGAA